MNKPVVFASDHNGIDLKKSLSTFLKQRGYTCLDIGPFDHSKKVDYVDYANQLCQIIANGDADRGILICGTGVGMSIAANRFSEIRAALVHNVLTAPKCREHNNSNVLCLGSWVTSEEESKEIISLWMDTPFGEGRHVKRVEKISKKSEDEIVFANGVFDILHTGHLELLRFAKSLGGKLVVGINSDRAVKALKGPTRPINNESDRKKMLESIDCVDEVVVFDDTDTKLVIDSVCPDILVKGGEWTADQVRIRDEVPNNIDIKIYPLVADYSTTNVLKKIKTIDGWQKSGNS